MPSPLIDESDLHPFMARHSHSGTPTIGLMFGGPFLTVLGLIGLNTGGPKGAAVWIGAGLLIGFVVLSMVDGGAGGHR